MKNYDWGWHLSVDASFCDKERMKSYDNVYNFIKQLVKDIDMVPYGEPEIVNFGTGDKAGFTAQQLISTSNICAHFANDIEAVFLDVFSCKEFDENVVLELVIEYFGTDNTIVACNNNKRSCLVRGK